MLYTNDTAFTGSRNVADLIFTLVKFPSIVAFDIYLNLLRLNNITVCNLIKHLPNTLSNISKSFEKRNLMKYPDTAMYSFSSSCFYFLFIYLSTYLFICSMCFSHHVY